MIDPVPAASVLTRSEPIQADYEAGWEAACEAGFELTPRAIYAVVALIWQRAQAALPVPAGRKPTEDHAQVWQVAKWLHELEWPDPSFHDFHWPEHPDDTGQRAGGWLHIVPSDTREQFLEIARLFLARFAALNAALSLPVPADRSGKPE